MFIYLPKLEGAKQMMRGRKEKKNENHDGFLQFQPSLLYNTHLTKDEQSQIANHTDGGGEEGD